MTNIKNFLTRHSFFIVFMLALGVYLGIKAVPENSWDGWRVGSAQALLSDKHWANDGFLKNYFLFLPQGYSKTVRYFDDPELRQHARGTATGELIGRRLYYTHYPSGYLLPTALLMKLGVENRFWFRFLEIIFSLAGLTFLYWFFTLISKSHLIALLGIFFYGASTIFLNYADSLAANPVEELLRPAIIALSVVALKKPEKKYLKYLIWILYFAFASSSFDSTFFVFAWLIGLDFIMEKKISPNKWLFWASAPIAAFGLQILQNVWYLGWHDALLDQFGAFKVQILGSRNNFFITHLQRWLSPLGWFFGTKWHFGILASAAGIIAIKSIKKYFPDEIFNEKFLYLAFFATLFNFLFFPSLFFHQARAVSIFGGLLVGILTVYFFKIVRQTKQRCTAVLGIFVLVLSLWFIQGKRTYAYIKNWPNNVWPIENINFDKKIKNLIAGDKVIFQMLGSDQKIFGSDRYLMAASEDEYYVGAPILGFTNTADLIRDFNYLKKRSEFPFSAIIITDKKEMIEKIGQKLLNYKARPVEKINDKFVLTILQ